MKPFGKSTFLRKARLSGTIAFLLLLGCTMGQQGPELRKALEKGRLLRVKGLEGEEQKEKLRKKEAVLRMMEGEKAGSMLVLIDKKKGKALPPSLQKARKKGSVRSIAPENSELIGRKIESPDLPDTEPSSSIDLPDIFDIFTRIY